MKKSTLTGLVTALTIGAVGVTTIGPAFARGPGDGPRGPGGPRFSFEQLDTNGDGLITPEELAERRAKLFAEQDTNGDGVLSPEEMIAAAVKHAQQKAEKRVGKMFEKNDANGDGVISQDEMPGADREVKMFEHLDTDGDGAISQDEMAAAKDKFGKGRKFQKPNN